MPFGKKHIQTKYLVTCILAVFAFFACRITDTQKAGALIIKDHGKAACQYVKACDHKYDHEKEESPLLKRKYKTKGIEATVLTIDRLTFNQYYIYNTDDFCSLQGYYTCELFRVHYNKGPPGLLLV